MKRTIDLTEGRDFSTREIRQNFIDALSVLMKNPKFPWSIFTGEWEEMKSDQDLVEKYRYLFPTGSVRDIKSHKKYQHFEDGSTCDCCGNPIKFSVFGDRLCKNCNEHLYKSVEGRKSWALRTEMIPEDFLAVYLNTRSNKEWA